MMGYQTHKEDVVTTKRTTAATKKTPTKAATGGPRRRKTTPGAIAIRDRQAEALRMRGQERMTLQEIADELGVNKSTICRDIQEAMEHRIVESVDILVSMENDQLDFLYRPLVPAIKMGDPKAILAALKIQERRSKLAGLDAPTKTHVSGDPGFRIVVDPDLLPQNADLSRFANNADANNDKG